MRGRDGGGGLAPTRCMNAGPVPEECAAPRLVECRPAGRLTAQRVGHDRCVVGEPQRRLADRPAAGVLEGLREVPVVEHRDRLDARFPEALDEATIEVEAPLERRAGARRLDPRPGDREAVGGNPEVGHDRDVVAVSLVVGRRGGAGVAVEDRAGPAAERVPDRWSPPVGRRRALDLVGRRGDAPDEVGRELAALRLPLSHGASPP